jgi:hypothetical protein
VKIDVNKPILAGIWAYLQPITADRLLNTSFQLPDIAYFFIEFSGLSSPAYISEFQDTNFCVWHNTC